MKSKIPYYYEVHCKNPNLKIEDCPYYIHEDCPNTCYLVKRLKNGISHQSKTGLQRFYERYPNWNEEVGIGAMVSEDIRRLG